MKLALISGGSKGLGSALCQTYLDADFEVVEFSRTAPHTFSVVCDISNPQQVADTVATQLAMYAKHPLEEIVVISNAATLDPIGASSHQSVAKIQNNLNTSFVSAIVFMSEAIRALQKSPCRKTVVNISSGAALKGYAGWSLYCASKAGLENYIRSLAAEQALEAQPFRTLNIDPGVMDTSMQTFIRASTEEDFPSRERFIGLHRTGALRAPTQVAEAIARIVAGSHVSGERLLAADFI